MARHINFRNDVDSSDLCIRYDFLDVILGVESAIECIALNDSDFFFRNEVVCIVILFGQLQTGLVIVSCIFSMLLFR